MPGRRERERELARRRYERRRQREIAKRAKRRQLLTRAGVITAILAVLGGSAFGISTAVSGGSTKHKTASTPPTPTSAPPTVFNGSCQYKKSGTASRDVGVPPQTGVQKRNYVATIKTNRGVITLALNGTAAPCTVNSFVYLATKHYFNNTSCHRLVTQGIYVLQCGDPTATGSGGPGYEFADENLTALGTGRTVTYPTATVAMANAGPGTNGSQFFLVYKPSPLPPAYTPFGQIIGGLAVLNTVSHAGSNNSNGPGDGKPKLAVTIESVTIRAA